MGYQPVKIWAPYYVITSDQVTTFTWEGTDANGVPYAMHPVPMLNGSFALPISNLNIPCLPLELFTALNALTPQIVTCCDFEDHTDFHQVVTT